MQRSVTSLSASNRGELLAGRGAEPSVAALRDDQRSRILAGTDTLDKTTDRIRHAQQVGEETEAMGHATLAELGTQRETIIRTTGRLRQTDEHLSISRRILNSMAWRIASNKIVMIVIIIILLGIIGVIVYVKFIKK